jgi:outer membrane protein OmpA-like peptidoglycan-associated protein
MKFGTRRAHLSSVPEDVQLLCPVVDPAKYDIFKPEMRVSDFDDFDIETEGLLTGTKERSWIWFGLIVSLAIHCALCAYFYRTRFQSVEVAIAPTEQAPTFRVRNVDIGAQLDKNSMDQTNPAAKPEPDKTDTQLPDEKKSFDKLLQDIQASAALPDDTRDVLPERPRVDQPDVNSVLTEIERNTAQTLTTNPNATHEQSLLNEAATSGRPQPALSGTELATSTTIKRPNTFTSKIPGDSAGPTKGRTPGFSDLDQLLAIKGPLGSGTKLRMPDDQLFEYDSAELQASAIVQLQKLGTLIQRNPKATFTVEGYTDSFGPPDYNLDLSRRRAEGVKRYLVENMGINPAQIETHGYGQTKFLVQPFSSSYMSSADMEAEIRRQQPNRRVEIVVHTDER